MAYDRYPSVHGGPEEDCIVGWEPVAACLGRTGARVMVIDAYPGVRENDLAVLADKLQPALTVETTTLMLPAATVNRLVAPDLTDDPVFGRVSKLAMADLLDPVKLDEARGQIASCRGRVLVAGPGAALVASGDLVVFADLPRWEAQQRQRRGEAGNLGAGNAGDAPAQLYKRAYFVDWRLADRHKEEIWPRVDYLLDTVVAGEPKLVVAATAFAALAVAATRPLRVVPFFDPAPWGGHWMERVFGLDKEAPNHGWCFDCVPEENSILLSFGRHRVELPAIDLVLREPRRLLGEAVESRFGAEFPIRFDMLDTMGGGHLSLQVHPLAEYIREHFGIAYTQDESYYLLDAEQGATVFLGLREGVSESELAGALHQAHRGETPFDVDRYVNRLPARRHDHFLIPAGTVHCSGAGSMVLEISATPYIFTFKLWDWARMGLDGRPRPTHLEHGLANIVWGRRTTWVQENLVARVERLKSGQGWWEERTGLHEAEFIETRRHWFDVPVHHERTGSVDVLNLVAGVEAVVESPDRAFDPFPVSYAETFILPAAAGPYSISPVGDSNGLSATIKASVR